MAGDENEQQAQPAVDDPFLAQALATFVQGMAGAGLPAPQQDILGGFWAGPQGDPNSPDWEGVPFRLPPKEGSLTKPYHEGDDFEVLNGMNTEQLAQFQDALVANGIVNEVIPGRIDENTRKGIGTLMALGNRQSVRWQEVLDGITRAGGLPDGTEQPSFDAPTRLAPDYARLAQDIKGTFRDRLGREPDQGEMAQLMAELDGWHKGSFDAQVGAARADFENQQTEGSQSGGTVRSVDPVARFQEHFERTYKPELNFVRDKGRAVETREQVEASTGLLSAMSERGVQ